MKKLLCIPCTETPNVDIQMKSVCCGSKNVETRLRRKNLEDCSENQDSESQDCSKCGCFNFTTRSLKSQTARTQSNDE